MEIFTNRFQRMAITRGNYEHLIRKTRTTRDAVNAIFLEGEIM